MTEGSIPDLPNQEASASTSAERQAVLGALGQLVEPLTAMLSFRTEVLVHDLSKLPNSIVASGSRPSRS